jgi:hypothetical protein
MNPGGLLLKRSLTFSNSSFSPERKSSMARLTASMEVISLADNAIEVYHCARCMIACSLAILAR